MITPLSWTDVIKHDPHGSGRLDRVKPARYNPKDIAGSRSLRHSPCNCLIHTGKAKPKKEKTQ